MLRAREIVAAAVWILALAPVVGCAPAIASMAMPNPARAAVPAQATQSYEVPPFREDHRYEATLAGWTASAVKFRIHLVNAERCGLPSSYSFDLLDDHGHRYPFQQPGAPRTTIVPGHLGATLNDTTVDGTFGAAIEGSTRYVVLEIRPRNDRACTALDFRWDFQG